MLRSDTDQTRKTDAGPVAVRRGIAAAGAAILLALLVISDLLTDYRINFAILYAIAVALCLWARSRTYLWILTGIAVVAAVAVVELSPDAGDGWPVIVIINRTLSISSILLTTIGVHALLSIWQRKDEAQQIADEQNVALEARNDELAQREEEIARQNEELQSQTEELERQSEELRVANEDLAQREQMLEALLDLSRSLTLDLSQDDTLEKICETLGHLVNGPLTGTAIMLRKGDHLEVRCHYGFGSEGVAETRFPIGQTFAELVLAQNKTGYIEDLSLRPDLKVPQPKNGAPMISVLAAPLVIHGKSMGTIEVYAREARSWSDEQIALIESLASQTSISLENAQLFDEIETERRRLATVLETVPFPVMICGMDCGHVKLNAACSGLMGLPSDTEVAVLPTGGGRWTMYRDGEEISFDQLTLVRAARGTFVQAEEKELVFHSGRRLSLLMSAAPIRDQHNRIVGAVCVAADVTEMRQLHRELDRRRREAEEASVRKSRFLAAASHDIRTPANAVGLIAELMKRSATNPAMSGEIPQLADELHHSCQSLVNLVNNVLDISRFENGKVELQESEFELDELLNEEFRQMLPLAQEKKLKYALHAPDDPVWMRTDRVKLGRVIGNLLGNAIKFTDAGSVVLNAARTDDGGITISVSDTGVGIQPQHLTHIFDEFFQLSEPHRSKGSGLGLAISKRLIEAMGGTITVQSTPGKGSTFTVTLPSSATFVRASAGARDGSQ